MSADDRAERARALRHEQALHRHLMQFGEAESLATPAWTAHDTTVRDIAGYLTSLWAPTATAADGTLVTEKGVPHARTSVRNLIVVVVDEAAAERVVRTMLNLGIRHPSRAIVLVPDRAAEGGAPLDARITAHCHAHPGDEREQICYEEIVLTVRGEAAAHLEGVVAPLLIHDLPTHVWWPGDPPFGDPIFDHLVDMCDRLIIDSSDFSDLLGGMRRLTHLRRRSGIGDLTWDRLAWWLELTAQFFDGPRFRRYLPNLNRLAIRYAVAPAGAEPRPRDPDEIAPDVRAPMSQALLYAGWIASRLEWRRDMTLERLRDGQLRLRLEGRYTMVELALEPVPTTEIAPGDLVSVRLRARGETGAGEFIIDREGDEAVFATNADGMTQLLRRVTMQPPTEAELLSADLVLERRDPVYDAALRAAVVFLAAAQRRSGAAA